MMDKVFVTNGCSNHTNVERQKEDYYATDPKCVNELLEVEYFQHNILEPCCGQGHISKELIKPLLFVTVGLYGLKALKVNLQ